jgi:NTP pyrophosphatase (non-canonical NTP hydrolase)
MSTAQQIAELSRWIDHGPSYATLNWEAHVWRRIAKVSEENGEVTEAFLGYIGENQRKGQFGSLDDVVTELLDVATCALGAVEHLTGNQGEAIDRLAAHVASRHDRAGLSGGTR